MYASWHYRNTLELNLVFSMLKWEHFPPETAAALRKEFYCHYRVGVCFSASSFSGCRPFKVFLSSGVQAVSVVPARVWTHSEARGWPPSNLEQGRWEEGHIPGFSCDVSCAPLGHTLAAQDSDNELFIPNGWVPKEELL